jgi:PadR family transcriptional regulator PadR
MAADLQAANRKFQKEITSGIASLILLRVLDGAKDPMYGYQISKVLGIRSEESPLLKQGALYPILRSLEKYGLLSSKVEPSVTGPPRRYYSITDPGRQSLTEWTHTWHEVKTFVEKILEGELDYE